MKAKHVVFAGATAGIGRGSSLEFARRGARLTLLCRNIEKGVSLASEIVDGGGLAPKVISVDISSLASVRQAADALLALGQRIDLLLNNAAVVSTQRREPLGGGEETLAVNHLALLLLTGLLLRALLSAPGTRFVKVASHANAYAYAYAKSMGFGDMQATAG